MTTNIAAAGIDQLVTKALSGERRALSRIITHVENATTEGREALTRLYTHTGQGHTAGITGGAGSGKSTLTAALAREYRRRDRDVGIIAVDPTSPFSHGSLLGDRIRMQDLTKDPAVFIRSMATRGELGGLAPATAEVASVLDACGKNIILIETVGAGQDEVEVASMAETTVVVLTPGGGDDVQAMKAGLMEVADILVVNKADLPGAEGVISQVKAALNLTSRGRLDTPLIETVATRGTGIPDLADAIDAHRRNLETSGEMDRLRLDRARRQVLLIVRQLLMDEIIREAEDGRLEALAEQVASREIDPYSAAKRLMAIE